MNTGRPSPGLRETRKDNAAKRGREGPGKRPVRGVVSARLGLFASQEVVVLERGARDALAQPVSPAPGPDLASHREQQPPLARRRVRGSHQLADHKEGLRSARPLLMQCLVGCWPRAVQRLLEATKRLQNQTFPGRGGETPASSFVIRRERGLLPRPITPV